MSDDARERPEDVFTPAAPVRDDMYAARVQGGLEQQVESALAQAGRQLVVYGDTGVGKTSLIEYLSRQFGYPLHRVEFGPPLDEILRGVLADLGHADELERVDRESKKYGGKIAVPMVVEGGGEVEDTTEVRSAALPRNLVLRAIEALEADGKRILFLDNYENALTSPTAVETHRQVAHLLKTLADRARGGQTHLKAVVAGIPSASEALIQLDQATSRRTEQVEVGRMRKAELDEIFVRGAEKLGMRFADNVRQRIVAYSDGFPYYTHLLALHAALSAQRRGSDNITEEDFDRGLDGALAGAMLELRTQYQHAAETSGDVKTRRSIMQALAAQRDIEVPFRSIREAFLQLHPRYRERSLNFLVFAVSKLKGEYEILSDRDLPKSTNNLYRFRNPLMRGYVRLRAFAEDRTQLTLWNPDDPDDELGAGETTTTSS